MPDQFHGTVDELTDSWTKDVILLARAKGFTLVVADARLIARRLADSVLDGQEMQSREERLREAKDEYCRILSLGRSKAEAAERAGASREALRTWEQRDPAFRQAVDEAGQKGRSQRMAMPARRAPRRMTVEVRARITTLLSSGASRKEALVAVGVSRQTFHTWLHRAPEFRVAVLTAEGRMPA